MRMGRAFLMATLWALFSFLITVATFGIILSVSWTIAGKSETPRLIGALLSAAIAISLGGFIVAWFSGGDDLKPSFSFGFLFGGISFGYILGLDLVVLLLALVSSLMSGTGGFLFHSLLRRRRDFADVGAR